MSIYLGVDAGGSKTHAVLTDMYGNVLGKGLAGNGNHQVNRNVAANNIRAACDAALQEAGITREQVSYAYFGLAGADREPDYEILRPMIADLEFANYQITCDTMIGMRAGTNKSYGAAIICGTGFNAAARNRNGEELQYGGFGFMYGDSYGAGSSLAMLAFRAVIRAWDGRGPATVLTELVLGHMGYSSVDELYEDVLYGRRSIPLDLVKTLFTAAQQGDPLAIEILDREGAELGNAVCTFIRRLNMVEDTFDIVYIGSVLNKGASTHLSDAIERIVAEQAPYARCVRLTTDPVVGSLMSAMEMDGITITPETEAKLKAFTF
ncbi:BadF/BadG/BcrA/BcrD ATPase family protein [Paenibacillus sp. UMB4589-SE434]|uniref:N-acetylglucosamine kinase n=1 Tax=Paenibacillus sp. UMB4589-SE434 TaxID=3046314 RepID=UPI00254CB021|nr:BadF/BadG/BcrA/BcrD ATPase family protein [Paenibacillus sp. UMB4589-SE434]MDK8182406.1 BadF/BadG/BcrA/BcrD ATPase family protein [Paenibacillus sp. UMB4589-SE434]